ncbi:hypothetical protein [Thermococcus sp.]
MRGIVLVALLLLGLPLVSAQPWVAQVKGAGLELVKSSPDGNLIFAGAVKAKNWDLVVAKVTPGGEVLWAKAYDTGGNDYISGLWVQEDGSVILVGTTDARGSDDVLVVKLSGMERFCGLKQSEDRTQILEKMFSR